MALSEADRKNFETLQRAMQNGDLALLEAIRRSDGKKVALVVGLSQQGEEVLIYPFAVMVEGNPYEDFISPMDPDYEAALGEAVPS